MTAAVPEATLESLANRLTALAAVSEGGPGVTRQFATPEHRRALELLEEWMQDAGMQTRIDAVGNLIGRYAAAEGTVDPKVLLMGSHHDTVRQGGAFDGAMGVLLAIACADALHRMGQRLTHHLDVVAFADEEGTRFGTSLLGSRALAGRFPLDILTWQDRDGVTVAVAMQQAAFAGGQNAAAIAEAAYAPDSVLGYVEAHIEQGPVLEVENLPVGVVTAIAHGTRHRLTVRGTAGHAGTVPMGQRRDALAAAAEMIAAIERTVEGDGVVATVGQVACSPGSINVIPGEATFSLDLRAPDSTTQRAQLAKVLATFQEIAERRGVGFATEQLYDSAGCAMDPHLTAKLEAAIERQGLKVRRLPSGAGHDAMALAPICPVAMLFVRCRGGISHNPAEHVEPSDIQTALAVLVSLLVENAPSRAA